MIIHFSIIIICFKEIYSWNRVFSPFILQSNSHNKNRDILKKRSANESNIRSANESNISGITPLTTESPSFIHKLTAYNSESENLNTSFMTGLILSTIASKPISSFQLVEDEDSKSTITTVKPSVSTFITRESEEIYSSTIATTELSPTEIVTNLINTSNPTAENVTNSTEFFFENNVGQLHSTHYILIALSVIAILCIIAYGVYHLYRKEQVRRLRLQLMPVYNFDPTESDDWENNLLEEEFSLRSKEKDKNPTTSPSATISVSEESTTLPLRQRSNVPVTHL